MIPFPSHSTFCLLTLLLPPKGTLSPLPLSTSIPLDQFTRGTNISPFLLPNYLPIYLLAPSNQRNSKMRTTILTPAALAVTTILTFVNAHGHQAPLKAGPHKSLWYNALPGDGGTQVRGSELQLPRCKKIIGGKYNEDVRSWKTENTGRTSLVGCGGLVGLVLLGMHACQPCSCSELTLVTFVHRPTLSSLVSRRLAACLTFLVWLATRRAMILLL